MDRAKRQRIPLSVILFDIDRFKKINDTYGHITGDRVIEAIAGRAKELCRPYDILGRYGGEGFILVLPSCDTSVAARVAERIREALESKPIEAAPEGILVTASFGVTELSHEKDKEVDSILRRADEALYRAKGEGRNRVCTAPQMPENDDEPISPRGNNSRNLL